jgi:hypothetical protein
MPTEENGLIELIADGVTVKEVVEEEYQLVYQKPCTMVDVAMHYCPGC